MGVSLLVPCRSGTGNGRRRPGWRAGLPDRAPGRQPQPGASLPDQPAAAGERAGQFLPRARPAVLDHRASGGEPPRVAGPAKIAAAPIADRPVIEVTSPVRPSGSRTAGHPPLGLGEPVLAVPPVFGQQLHPLQRAGPVRDHPGRVGLDAETLRTKSQCYSQLLLTIHWKIREMADSITREDNLRCFTLSLCRDPGKLIACEPDAGFPKQSRNKLGISRILIRLLEHRDPSPVSPRPYD